MNGEAYVTPRVLVVEPRKSGHLLVYVRVLMEELAAQGMHSILAIGSGVRDSLEYDANLSRYTGDLVEFELPLTSAVLERLATAHEADLVIVPHGDELAGSVAIKGYRAPGTLTLLVMRDPAWEGSNGWKRRLRLLIKTALLRRASRRHNVALVWLRQLGYSGSEPHVIDPFVPDGTYAEITKGAAVLRSNLGLSDDVTWFTITGAITDRKNLPLVLDALASLQSLMPSRQFGLLLIGPLRLSDPWDSALILAESRRRGVRITIDDRVLTNFEMNCAVAAADVVVMAYSTHSPNSTMVKAYALGIPLVVAAPASVQSFARALGFEHVSELSVEAMAKSMRSVLASPRPGSHFDVASTREFALGLIGRDAAFGR